MSRIVPMVTDHTDRGEKSYDVYSRLLKDRIIFLVGEINEMSASLVCAQLLALEADSQEKPINLYINSPGGVVYDGFMILDTMAFVKCPVYTVGSGIVASMAAMILCCGTKGHRYALQNTRIMLHQPSGGARGQITDMQIQVNEGQYIKNTLTDIIVQRTGQPLKRVVADINRDFYMSSKEALEYGLVDEIIAGDFDKGLSK